MLWTNPIRRIIKHFDFELICDFISDPEVKNISFLDELSRDFTCHWNFFLLYPKFLI